MKQIILHELPGGFKSLEIMRAVLERAGPQGIGVAEMRTRIRILDALEAPKIPGSVLLEDADWQVLKKCFETFPFGIANRHLLKIIDAVLDPPSGEPTSAVPTPNDAAPASPDPSAPEPMNRRRRKGAPALIQ